jgi:hypothetical protein
MKKGTVSPPISLSFSRGSDAFTAQRSLYYSSVIQNGVWARLEKALSGTRQVWPGQLLQYGEKRVLDLYLGFPAKLHPIQSEGCKDFWRWRVTHRITGFLDVIHRQEFYVIRKRNVLETGSVFIPQTTRGGDTYTLLCPLARVNLNDLTVRTERDPVSETLRFVVFRIPGDGESPQTH